MADQSRPSLKSFDAYADRNGQGNAGGDGQDDARDLGQPRRTLADLERDPMGQAETARLASGRTLDDATDATAAETPPENLRHIADARLDPGAAKPDPRAAEAIERATAALGEDE